MPGSAGHSGACTTWPADRYASTQPRQLSADNHSPWISTIGGVTFDIVSSVELRYNVEGGNAMSELPDWAARLDLSPHPEGGWFRETWRSGLTTTPVRPAARLRRSAQRRNRDPVPADARPAVGLAHGAQRRAVALPSGQSAAAGVRSRTGQCRNASARRRHQRRRTAAAGGPRQGTGSGPARATTSPRWSAASWCPVSTTPTSRWPLLPTEQLHRRRHQRGIVGGGCTVGQQQGVLHTDAGLHTARPRVFQ